MDNFENESTLKMKSSSNCSNLIPTCLANCNYVIGDCDLIEVESDVKCNSMFPVEQRSIEKGVSLVGFFYYMNRTQTPLFNPSKLMLRIGKNGRRINMWLKTTPIVSK